MLSVAVENKTREARQSVSVSGALPKRPLQFSQADLAPGPTFHQESPKHILLTVDVEDWFQVENLKECIPFSSWSSRELRVERNTHRLLDLLDSPLEATGSGRRQRDACRPKATFFVLGWIARRLPGLVREIHARGHEVASHGYFHRLCSHCSPELLREDLRSSRQLLEDMLGLPVHGYRAPGFSISESVLKMVEEAGYRYDSSYNSFSGNIRYGRLDLVRYPKLGIARRVTDGLYELPVSNVELGGYALPMGGGGYFRLFPVDLFMRGVRAVLNRESTYVFFLHPWEIDDEQPRVTGLSRSSRLKHYLNLHKTMSRLGKLIQSSGDCRFLTCTEYLEYECPVETQCH